LPHLAAWRDYRLMSGIELARRAGVGRATISRAERGEEIVSFANIHKIAAALKITAEQLVNEAPPTPHIAGAA
jgi:transcriptional regulator with XRE-family HTH domain